jgi:hypothetical protein
MAKRTELLKKIQARKTEKVAVEKAKWAKMRSTAASYAPTIEKGLAKLAALCAAASEGFENLRENLDLVQAPKEASLKVRVAAARSYAKSFKRIADEAPDQLAEAVQEAYKSLDEIAGTLELAADQLGVDLNAAPAEGYDEVLSLDDNQFGVEKIDDEAEPTEEAPVDEEIKEGAGSDWYATDRDESGQPKKPEQVDVPRVANSGPGGAGFMTDRNNEGKPTTPSKVKIPQAQGEAVNASKNRQGHVRPMTQIVPSGTPQPAGAEEFVKNIPQAQGRGQTPGNKAAAAGRRR